MKRIKNILIALLVGLTAVCTPVYAASSESHYVDEYGNTFDMTNGSLVVIYDEFGNIVESCLQPRSIQVNGTQYSIPPRGSFVTAQYTPSSSFDAGFYFEHSSCSGNATTPDSSITVLIRNATTLNATTRYGVATKTFSTTKSDNIGSSYYIDGIQSGCSLVRISAPSISSSRPYYDAKYSNNTNNYVTISLFVSTD